MSKGLKILFVSLMVVIGLLAASTGFFFAKTRSLQKGTKTNQSATDTTKKTTDTATTTDSAKVTNDSSSTVTEAAPLGNRPSSPSDTVTVEAGETLFAIGQKVGVSWTAIAEANGVEADKIQAGQTLIVPKNNQISYTLNKEKAASLQQEADAGKNLFRLSAADTAKSDAPTAYALAATDTFAQIKIDEAAGTAQVTATHGDKSYVVNLIQPVTKGSKGIWAIESIKPSV